MARLAFFLLVVVPVAALRLHGAVSDHHTLPSEKAQHQASALLEKAQGPYELLLETVNNGGQVCEGSSPEKMDQNSVALVMIGESFRSRNRKTNVKRVMDDGTLESQRMLSENHVANLVQPLEEAGLRVDVFLAHASPRVDEPDFAKQRRPDYFSQLKNFYGPHRVVESVPLNPHREQFFHATEMLWAVQNHTVARGKSYKFLMFLRYDMKLMFSLNDISKQIDASDSKHASSTSKPHLDYFMHAEDYAFMLPGGLSNCMVQMFADCLALKSCPGMDAPDADGKCLANNQKCYDYGPLTLAKYTPRAGGYVDALNQFQTAVEDVGALPKVKVHGGGLYAIADGKEHGMTWTPENADIDGFHPSYYKVVLAR